jgi:F-type H+-transporting ATPase subunit a
MKNMIQYITYQISAYEHSHQGWSISNGEIPSPLDQFQVLYIFSGLTNEGLAMLTILGSFIVFFLFIVHRKSSLIPSNWQSIHEYYYLLLASLVKDTLSIRGMKFFPFIFTLATFISLLNLGGMIPYAYAVTSQPIITLTLSISI